MGILSQIRHKKRSYLDKIYRISDSERNELIRKLHQDHNFTVIELASLTELTRQQIYQILREGK